MDVGDKTTEGLIVCADSKWSHDQVEFIADAAIKAIIDKKPAEESLSEGSVSDIDGKLLNKMLSALACTMLEAAKMDLSNEELRSLLTNEHEMVPQRAQAIANIYGKQKASLRSVLAQSSSASALPTLMSTDWRMDIDVADSMDRVNKKPLYHMSLHTLSPAASRFTGTGSGNPEQDIRFAMTEEQLEELLFRLRDACRTAEGAQV